ncbi:hypothetical protein [Thioalkalivibrio thiocyanodenitrificans]|uniref:hypothetical protein n=1 Tax=Thioalkalivibrio thiocyanodenitrificans TaxID=243063 RepID=UPI0003625C5E|nr:hypothetical protein [Thioalkalivibrio thiocyanodenitrificans]
MNTSPIESHAADDILPGIAYLYAASRSRISSQGVLPRHLGGSLKKVMQTYEKTPEIAELLSKTKKRFAQKGQGKPSSEELIGELLAEPTNRRLIFNLSETGSVPSVERGALERFIKQYSLSAPKQFDEEVFAREVPWAAQWLEREAAQEPLSREGARWLMLAVEIERLVGEDRIPGLHRLEKFEVFLLALVALATLCGWQGVIRHYLDSSEEFRFGFAEIMKDERDNLVEGSSGMEVKGGALSEAMEKVNDLVCWWDDLKNAVFRQMPRFASLEAAARMDDIIGPHAALRTALPEAVLEEISLGGPLQKTLDRLNETAEKYGIPTGKFRTDQICKEYVGWYHACETLWDYATLHRDVFERITSTIPVLLHQFPEAEQAIHDAAQDVTRYSKDPVLHAADLSKATAKLEAAKLSISDALEEVCACYAGVSEWRKGEVFDRGSAEPSVQADPQEHQARELEKALEEVSLGKRQLEVELAKARDREAEALKEAAQAKAEAFDLRQRVEAGEARLKQSLEGQERDPRWQDVRECLSGSPTPEQVLRAVEWLWGDRVRILDSAYESAAQVPGFEYGARMFGLLRTLVTDYVDSLRSGRPDAEAREWLGEAYRATESETIRKSKALAQKRHFFYKGKSRAMFAHLGIGVADNIERTLRVHFLWDAEDRMVVIGHAGKHLPLK